MVGALQAAGDADGGQKRLQSMRASRDARAAFAELAPAAYAPPTAAVCEFLAAVGLNWVSSEKPLGAPVAQEGGAIPAVSAGHVSSAPSQAATPAPLQRCDLRSVPLSADGWWLMRWHRQVSHPSATYAATVGVFEFLDWRDSLRAAALAGR